MQTYEQHSKTKVVTSVITILLIAAVVLIADHRRPLTAATLPVASTYPAVLVTPTTTVDSVSTVTSSSYKDGTYQATSGYYVPHGQEEVSVSLKLSSGTVTDVSIQNSENNRDSARYQEDFVSVYKSYVVGKKISGLRIGAVAGASDTAAGFNEALSKIASQAQA